VDEKDWKVRRRVRSRREVVDERDVVGKRTLAKGDEDVCKERLGCLDRIPESADQVLSVVEIEDEDW
jgi:hypothetical protein